VYIAERCTTDKHTPKTLAIDTHMLHIHFLVYSAVSHCVCTAVFTIYILKMAIRLDCRTFSFFATLDTDIVNHTADVKFCALCYQRTVKYMFDCDWRWTDNRSHLKHLGKVHDMYTSIG